MSRSELGFCGVLFEFGRWVSVKFICSAFRGLFRILVAYSLRQLDPCEDFIFTLVRRSVVIRSLQYFI